VQYSHLREGENQNNTSSLIASIVGFSIIPNKTMPDKGKRNSFTRMNFLMERPAHKEMEY
jgi:hypothetical protein